MPVVETVVTAGPVLPAGLIVDIKRNGARVARMEQSGTAWSLEVYGPEWRTWCADIVDAYKSYVDTCRQAGVKTDGDDVLTLIEIKRPYGLQYDPTTVRTGKRLVAQIVNQIDNTWALNVCGPPSWNRVTATVEEAFKVLEDHLYPHPERGPIGGGR